MTGAAMAGLRCAHVFESMDARSSIDGTVCKQDLLKKFKASLNLSTFKAWVCLWPEGSTHNYSVLPISLPTTTPSAHFPCTHMNLSKRLNFTRTRGFQILNSAFELAKLGKRWSLPRPACVSYVLRSWCIILSYNAWLGAFRTNYPSTIVHVWS